MLRLVPIVRRVIKVEVERQAKVHDLAEGLTVKVGAMASFREIAYAMNREIVIHPERAQGICPWTEHEEEALDVFGQRLGVVKPTGKMP